MALSYNRLKELYDYYGAGGASGNAKPEIMAALQRQMASQYPDQYNYENNHSNALMERQFAPAMPFRAEQTAPVKPPPVRAVVGETSGGSAGDKVVKGAGANKTKKEEAGGKGEIKDLTNATGDISGGTNKTLGTADDIPGMDETAGFPWSAVIGGLGGVGAAGAALLAANQPIIYNGSAPYASNGWQSVAPVADSFEEANAYFDYEPGMTSDVDNSFIHDTRKTTAKLPGRKYWSDQTDPYLFSQNRTIQGMPDATRRMYFDGAGNLIDTSEVDVSGKTPVFGKVKSETVPGWSGSSRYDTSKIKSLLNKMKFLRKAGKLAPGVGMILGGLDAQDQYNQMMRATSPYDT